MKITQNPSFIQQNIQATKVQKTTGKASTTNIPTANTSVAVSVVKNNSQSLKSINTLQKDFAQTQQLFGALTQLTEAIELFKQAPNAYQENMKKILAEVQKNFPQLVKNIEKNISNPQQMMAQTNNVKNELSTKIASQKKAITHYLISEQNKDAVQKKSITTVDTQKIATKVSNDSVTPVHNPRITQITQLLNS